MALQIATALVCVEPRQQNLQQAAAGDSAGRMAACLAQARATVEQDEELQLELRHNLEAAAAEAAVLVELYPPFAAMCARHPWVAAQLAAAAALHCTTSRRGLSALWVPWLTPCGAKLWCCILLSVVFSMLKAVAVES